LGETLFCRIASIPARRASSRVVEEAFALQSIGLAVTPEMAAELEKGRGEIVHTALMFDEPPLDRETYRVRIGIVRTMLVALIARAVGYRGAITGWTRRPGRRWDAADPTWWTVDDEASEAARCGYVASSGFTDCPV
jgi:hypothetical protein